MIELLLYFGLAAIVAGLVYYNGGHQSVTNPTFWFWMAVVTFVVLLVSRSYDLFGERYYLDTDIIWRSSLACLGGWLLELLVELVVAGVIAYREQKAREALALPQDLRAPATDREISQVEPVFYDFAGNEVTIWRRCFRHAPA